MDTRGREASPSIGTPAAEFAIDDALVSGLLADQHQDLARLPLRAVGEGWDNATYRLGDHLAVRLPRRAVSRAYRKPGRSRPFFAPFTVPRPPMRRPIRCAACRSSGARARSKKGYSGLRAGPA